MKASATEKTSSGAAIVKLTTIGAELTPAAKNVGVTTAPKVAETVRAVAVRTSVNTTAMEATAVRSVSAVLSPKRTRGTSDRTSHENCKKEASERRFHGFPHSTRACSATWATCATPACRNMKSTVTVYRA